MFLKCPLISKVPEILLLYHDTHHPGINATLTNSKGMLLGRMFEQVKDYVGTVISSISEGCH